MNAGLSSFDQWLADSIKFTCVILISKRFSIIDKWPVIYKRVPREIFAVIGDKWLSSEKWYKLNKRELLFWLSIYSLAFKSKVILSLAILGLSDAVPINTTDKEEFGRSFSSRLRTHISDAMI